MRTRRCAYGLRFVTAGQRQYGVGRIVTPQMRDIWMCAGLWAARIDECAARVISLRRDNEPPDTRFSCHPIADAGRALFEDVVPQSDRLSAPQLAFGQNDPPTGRSSIWMCS